MEWSCTLGWDDLMTSHRITSGFVILCLPNYTNCKHSGPFMLGILLSEFGIAWLNNDCWNTLLVWSLGPQGIMIYTFAYNYSHSVLCVHRHIDTGEILAKKRQN